MSTLKIPKKPNDKWLIEYFKATDGFINNKKAFEDYYYNSVYDFLLQEGRMYKRIRLTEEEREIVNEVRKELGFKPKKRNCFYNSQMLALQSSGRIKYVEGQCLNMIPIMHGFNTINGKVVDFTWDDGNGNPIYGVYPKGVAYYGVELANRQVMKQMSRTGMASSLIDCHEERFPILKEKFNKDG